MGGSTIHFNFWFLNLSQCTYSTFVTKILPAITIIFIQCLNHNQVFWSTFGWIISLFCSSQKCRRTNSENSWNKSESSKLKKENYSKALCLSFVQPLILHSGLRGCWHVSQVSWGKGGAAPWTSCQFIPGSDRKTFSHVHLCSHLPQISLSHYSVFAAHKSSRFILALLLVRPLQRLSDFAPAPQPWLTPHHW